MLRAEGYAMFKGTMQIVPRNPDIKPFTVEGTFLYKPDTGCWYCNGSSYPSRICVILRDDTAEDIGQV